MTNSSSPKIGVAAITKRHLPTGYVVERGIGSFDTRGIAVRIAHNPDYVPIGLLDGAVMKRPIEHGQMITWHDVDIPDSLALTAWHKLQTRTA